ncbi:MAG: ATPase [Zetaproteobacteria bacterium CG_4_9_14_3_um_filter_49_83]|nr:MAG: ATPase [Zetaproteobacteria bacterium CG1_02_49_23]PIQ30046.1 MAG: ATPase [Zetaproteobacteria bacterium CG17_big_fil_post_rev_8_21_14_2_50_50_13]PIV29212.1 MAG: ATPase [Zetaproteobacteria bacterium CG02_land_8_20_14_3_00_50_9]PIY56006.1 MAG: ATPase [Zetaproteobacteria bacterium CG_4_10_14_0_8_um_filter_49_80]PJA36318.1 MAG: ATPase [Zetaproteobacteria bacterium CG_4_9_14_3_um_filter_49_83]
MIVRRIYSQLQALLGQYPAVALLGPRQVGKTTLALELAEGRDSIYLDLESDADRAKLQDPELYLSSHQDKLVILDEVQRLPGLFQNLRGLIDQGRRQGRKSGQFLLLGSASLELLRQSSETLAGRIAYTELTPFDASEAGANHLDALWVRGGFAESYLAGSDAQSLRWRRDFIRTYLERDIPQLGPRIPAETLRRFWTMLAHNQGSVLNAAALARGLGVDGKTVASYLDLMVDLLLVRRLQPWHGNLGKRMVKSPKVYVRDSGILHALVGMQDKEALLGHPVAGASWEGFVIENLLAVAGSDVEASFFRTSTGVELDLVLQWPSGRKWAVEIKRSLAPTLSRGFHSACEDVNPDAAFVVYPGSERFLLSSGVECISLNDSLAEIDRVN